MQTAANQRDSLLRVNQGFQDEKENGNGARVLQPLQSGVRNPKLILHPPRYSCLGIRQCGIERTIAATAPPDHSALIQQPDERAGLVAVPDLDGAVFSDPAPKARIVF